MSNIRVNVAYHDHANYTAGHAAKITGVPPVLQRNWRSRGLLPEIGGIERNAKFTIKEIVRMSIMRALSEGGMSIKATQAFSLDAAEYATNFLMALPGSVAIKADEPALEQAERKRIEDWAEIGNGRFLFICLPEREGRSPYRRSDLTDLHKLLDEEDVSGLLIDLHSVARRIHKSVELPLRTHVLTREENKPWA